MTLDESDIIALEYNKRIERNKKELKDFGFDEKYLEGKRLLQLTNLLTTAREEAFKRGKTIEQIKKEKELSLKRQLEEQKQKLYEQELEQKKQLQKLQDEHELKMIMNTVSQAETQLEFKTLPSQAEEKQELDQSPPSEIVVGFDEWGKGMVTRKIRGKYV